MGRWLPLVPIVAGVIVYAGSFAGPFIFDDLTSIPENPHVRQLWPPWEALTAPPNSTVVGRPIVSLSLALNYALGGFNVWGYHAFNLTIHLLTALLLFGVVRRTLQSQAFRERFERSASWLAMVVATIWTVHPLQTDAVTYVIQRTELLVGLFYLSTLYCFIRGCHSSKPRRWFALAIVACALGMGSKEVMATAPVMVLLYDRTFVSGSFPASFRRHVGLYVGLALTWLILGAVLLTWPRSDTVGFGHGVTAWEYLRTQAGVILWYLRLCFWPRPLVISHGWPIAATVSQWLAPGLIVVALLGLTLWGLWRRHWAGFVGSWFFLILAPTSSVVPIITEVAAERRMYLPLAAVVVLVVIGGGWIVRKALDRPSAQRPVPQLLGGGLAAVLAGLLGYGTVQRNQDYRSAVAIWRDAVAHCPENHTAHVNLGNALFAIGEIDEGLRQYDTALEIKPDHAETHYNLANVLVDQQRLPEAIEHYHEALRIRPDFAEAHNNFGRALALQDRLDEAVAHFTQALRIKPDYLEAHVNLGKAFAREQKWGEAVAHFDEALRLDARSIVARMGLADALLDQGAFDPAVAEYRRVLDIAPDHADAHCNLGIALAMQNRMAEAIAELREALRLDPNHAAAQNALDRILADQRRTTPD